MALRMNIFLFKNLQTILMLPRMDILNISSSLKLLPSIPYVLEIENSKIQNLFHW